MLKELARAWGLEPEKILTGDALAEPHRAYACPDEREKEEMRALGSALKDTLAKDIMEHITKRRSRFAFHDDKQHLGTLR